MIFKIGVMGSAKMEKEEVLEKARLVGKEIANSNCIVVTGASTGVPYEAVRAAKKRGGFTLGVSPAYNEEEHTHAYQFPVEDFDVLIYTGFGKKGRNVVSIRSCDAVIFISGGSGTLNEFTIAYDEEKVCGVLTESGGISSVLKELEEKYLRGKKPSGKVIFDSDPAMLVEKVIAELKGA